MLIVKHQENISLMSWGLCRTYPSITALGRGGVGEMHINWHLSESTAPVKHVGILNWGKKRDSERKSGEEGRRRRRRRRKKERREGSLLSHTEVHCVVFSSPLSSAPSCRPCGLLPVWLIGVLNPHCSCPPHRGDREWQVALTEPLAPAPVQKQHNALIGFSECWAPGQAVL